MRRCLDARSGLAGGLDAKRASQEGGRRKAAELYCGVFADPMAFFGHLEEQGVAEDVSFEYALVETTGSGAPELLVRASGAPDLWNGVVENMPFTAPDDGSELVVPSVLLNEGAAGSGGFSGSVSASAYGNGFAGEWDVLQGAARALCGAIHGMTPRVHSALRAIRRLAAIRR